MEDLPKIIFATTEELKPWEILLGNDYESAANKKGQKTVRKLFGKKPLNTPIQ